MEGLLERFDLLNTRTNRWLIAHSVAVLRIALGCIFLTFGLLKFFPGVSPIEVLATRTAAVLSFGLVTGHAGMVLIAALECMIGLCFVTGKFQRIGVALLAFQMLGAMSPLVLFPGELFAGPYHAPTLAAQYIIKDVVLVAAGMVIAATLPKLPIVTVPSVRHAVRAHLPKTHRVLRPAASHPMTPKH